MMIKTLVKTFIYIVWIYSSGCNNQSETLLLAAAFTAAIHVIQLNAVAASTREFHNIIGSYPSEVVSGCSFFLAIRR